MASECVAKVRRLYSWEIQEACRVFDWSIDYRKIRLHECVSWPNAINRIGTRLKGMPYIEIPNAVTLGNHCFFPVKMPDHLIPISHSEHYKIGWLVHELTHAWQYQRMGWRYLRIAIQSHLQAKAQTYDFGSEQGLLQAIGDGWRLADFNLEQQGDIARTYYDRVVRGMNVDAWKPFIKELQSK